MTYVASALLPPNTKHSQSDLLARLTQKFTERADIKVINTEKVDVTIDGWHIFITFINDDGVLEESKDIARIFAKERPDQSVIASCAERYDVSTDPDTEMAHFNDYVFVLEVLESFGDTILFDPYNQSFI